MSLDLDIFDTEDGNPGLYSKLITVVQNKVKTEAKLQNLTTSEYAKFYLALSATVLQSSVQLTLEVDKTVEEIKQIQAQTELLVKQKEKLNAEIALIQQKQATEQAQIKANGVDVDSVIGRQKQLYQAQTNGFARDAEQKAAKLLIDTWSVRRTTDDINTAANETNKLQDEQIGEIVGKLLTGITESRDLIDENSG